MNNKKILVLLLVFIFGLTIVTSENIDAKNTTVVKGKKKTTWKHPGKKKSNWTVRKTTYYSKKKYTTKYRKKYVYETRNKYKEYTKKTLTTYYSGGKKKSSYKGYTNWNWVNGKRIYKNYRYVKYNKSGKITYDYVFKKNGSTGKITYKYVYSGGVKKKYYYNASTGKQTSIYQYRSGKWIKVWPSIPTTPTPPTVINPPVEGQYPTSSDISNIVAGIPSYKKSGSYLIVQAKSNSTTDINKTQKVIDEIHEGNLRWDNYDTWGKKYYQFADITNPANSSLKNSKTGIRYGHVFGSGSGSGGTVTVNDLKAIAKSVANDYKAVPTTSYISGNTVVLIVR